MLRHFAAELKRKQDAGDKTAVGQVGRKVCVLAMHPGEVSTDMADVELGWEVEGIIGAEESITGMLRVVDDKGKDTANSGTFWTWDGRVSTSSLWFCQFLEESIYGRQHRLTWIVCSRNILGECYSTPRCSQVA